MRTTRSVFKAGLKQWKKFVACSVTLSLLYGSVVVPVLEANLWEDRRVAQKREHPQYAQLPAHLNAGFGAQQASESIPPVGSIHHLQSQNLPVSSQANRIPGFKEAAAVLPPALLALHYSYGEIVKIKLSKDKTAPFVFLIQDAH